MLATKRYEYMPFNSIQIHPLLDNHRALRLDKVAHLEQDILKNGLLEPLIVWERVKNSYYLIGGFHRLTAIRAIRAKHHGYFDRVDVRVVTGELDEMKALNLKLNVDRLDTRITDFFDTVMYLNNANWEKERIAAFLDKSVTWLEEILRYVPGMDSRIRHMLEEGTISWAKAKGICRQILAAPPELEKEVADKLIEASRHPDEGQAPPVLKRVLSPSKAIKRLSSELRDHPQTRYTLGVEDLICLVTVLAGKDFTDEHVDRIRRVFPGLLE